MADVKWTFFADTAAAERAIQRLEQQNAKLENSLSQISRKSKDSSASVTQGLKMQAASVASLVSGYLTLGNVVTSVYTENLKLAKQADDIANRFDVATRKWRILTNQSALEGEESKQQIFDVAQKYGFTNTQGMDAARELTSAGFSAEEARGPALESLFKSLAANQKFDRDTDAGPLAKASASYLQSQGQALSGENLEKIGMMVDKLADVSTLDIADMQELAKHGAGMAGKLTQEEQFAGLTHLIKEGRPGSEAANALEKVTLSLTGKGDKKKSQEALKEMGLTFEDVDMIGESFLDATKKLKKGLESVPVERQDTLLSKLFGVEHFSPAKSLITKVSEVEGLTKGLDDKAGFEADIAIGTGGRAAGGRRLEAVEESQLEQFAGKYSDEDVKRAYRVAAREQGYSPARISLNQLGYDVFRGFGRGQEGSMEGIGINSGANGDALLKRMVQLLEASVMESEKQTGAIKANKQLNRDAQGEGAR